MLKLFSFRNVVKVIKNTTTSYELPKLTRLYWSIASGKIFIEFRVNMRERLERVFCLCVQLTAPLAINIQAVNKTMHLFDSQPSSVETIGLTCHIPEEFGLECQDFTIVLAGERKARLQRSTRVLKLRCTLTDPEQRKYGQIL